MIKQLTARSVFLGAPGAGKGTQALRLVDETTGSGAVLHISTGDMLREQVKAGTDLGAQAKTFMDQGKLVPDEVMIGMVEERISRPDAQQAWILDGFPRTLPQAEALDERLNAAGKSLSHVVYFQVPQEVLVRRLSGRWTCSNCGAIWNTEFKPTQKEGVCDACGGELKQRADDRPEAVSQRLEVYRSQTEPLLAYYRERGVLQEVDADRAPDLVFTDLIEVLSN